jgi:hypothetical protein
MRMNTSTAILVVASVIAPLIAAGHASDESHDQQAHLVRDWVNASQRKLPMIMGDDQTRFDAIAITGDHQITYDFTLVKLSSKDINQSSLNRLIWPMAHQPACGSVEVRTADFGWTRVYRYRANIVTARMMVWGLGN